MHDYSIDRHPKEVVLFVLAFAAISITPLLDKAGQELVAKINVATGWSWAITTIPVFALFSLIYWIFNTRLWRVSWLRRLMLVPDLNGRWKCEGVTVLKAGEDSKKSWIGEVTITQSWSKLSLRLKTDKSESRSTAAAIVHEPGSGYRMLYQYSNDPKANQKALRIHEGAAEVLFSEDGKSGVGTYFTDQHRRTVGTLTLTRLGKR